MQIRHVGFDNKIKAMLEDLFGMRSGYVMDFSNASFASFVESEIGFDPYTRYEGSKAAILRAIWASEPLAVVAALNLSLLDYWKLMTLRNGRTPSEYQQFVVGTSEALFQEASTSALTAEDLAFLDLDLGEVDLNALPPELTTGDVVADRIGEIDRALEASAPLAVIFLVGSTIEGMLSELARGHVEEFIGAKSAPKIKGRVKPLSEWTLSELIKVSRELGVLSADVARHADQVRNFRNYIHPRQQLQENFKPRIETAQIAYQVLKGALVDLEKLRSGSTVRDAESASPMNGR